MVFMARCIWPLREVEAVRAKCLQKIVTFFLKNPAKRTENNCNIRVFLVAPTGFEPNNRGSGQSRISLKAVMLSGIPLGGIPTAIVFFRPFPPSPLENVRIRPNGFWWGRLKQYLQEKSRF